MLGDIYEYMLDKLSTFGQNGQFRTPAQIRNLMVNLIQPKPDDCICDPACGTAGILISSANYIREHYANKMSEKQWVNPKSNSCSVTWDSTIALFIVLGDSQPVD